MGLHYCITDYISFGVDRNVTSRTVHGYFEEHAMCNKCRETADNFHIKQGCRPHLGVSIDHTLDKAKNTEDLKGQIHLYFLRGLLLLPVVDSAALLAVVCLGRGLRASGRQHTQQAEAQGQ